MSDIEKVKELLKHKNDYDLAYGAKIYRPYAMGAEDWEILENLLKENQANKEKIKELEEILDKYEKQLDLDYVDKNYIPKAKLIEIADKYKKILKKLNKSEDIDRIKAINERLILIQELLLQEGDK